MCGGKFSSRIAREEQELYGDSTYVDLTISDQNIQDTLHYIESNIHDLESVYFAGGEPLIMENHYAILELLLRHGKHDLDISYNTNLTKLSYKKHQVLDYWKQFSQVTVGASIDLHGPRAAYVRSGTDYAQVERNYLCIRDHVKFTMTSIVHLFNVINLPVLQRHWIQDLGLNPGDMSFRALTFPEHQSLQVLPEPHKQRAQLVIDQHVSWLKSWSGTEHLIDTWALVSEFMHAQDQSHLLAEFFRLNDDKDRYRKEKFEQVFPEYQDLRSWIR